MIISFWWSRFLYALAAFRQAWHEGPQDRVAPQLRRESQIAPKEQSEGDNEPDRYQVYWRTVQGSVRLAYMGPALGPAKRKLAEGKVRAEVLSGALTDGALVGVGNPDGIVESF